jgi:hypothetical protein
MMQINVHQPSYEEETEIARRMGVRRRRRLAGGRDAGAGRAGWGRRSGFRFSDGGERVSDAPRPRCRSLALVPGGSLGISVSPGGVP